MKQRIIFKGCLVALLIASVSCKGKIQETAPVKNEAYLRTITDSILDNWHQAASKADFEAYFGFMTSDAIFIGTDATEHWDVIEFKDFSKPYFDKGKAWDFTPLERHVFISENDNVVWFDELLDTWMGICRGSGVLKRENEKWKIAHYVLSVTVPNDSINQLIELKKETDSILTESF